MASAPQIIARPSPNFGPRRDGLKPEFIVVHYTAMDTAEAALDRLCDPAPEVSAHYLICDKGRIFQLVAEDMRAWHAGAGSWQGKRDINSRSIGIELDNRGTHPFSEPQMSALEALLPAIMTRWAIAPTGVIGHSDMAPGRKFDPGPRFDWQRLALQGLATWPRVIDPTPHSP
ncbi:N-acetylmuramoyl-L-alanine amidase AmiD precursor [Shimia sp. SK013]|nr:N-acetylmuramoyl-L-alanine amidase AmiD precursor [Shimia sp. SK013]